MSGRGFTVRAAATLAAPPALVWEVLTDVFAYPIEERLAPSAQVRECAAWYAALDEAVAEAGVRDAQAAPLAGFPYLRVDRAHAALRDRAAQSAAAYAAYVERLGESTSSPAVTRSATCHGTALDRLPGFDARPARTFAVQRTRDCGRLLRELDLVRPRARALLLQRATVPDEYSSIARLAGLHPLTQFALAAGIKNWEAIRAPRSIRCARCNSRARARRARRGRAGASGARRDRFSGGPAGRNHLARDACPRRRTPSL